MGEPRRDLLAVVRHQDDWWSGTVGASAASWTSSRSRDAQVKAGERFVEQEQLRLAHQRPRQQDLLSLALGDDPEGSVPDLPDAAPGQQAGRPSPSSSVSYRFHQVSSAP